MEARQDNENFKKRQEEEEKRAKQEAEVIFYKLFKINFFNLKPKFQMKKRTIERKSREGLLSSVAKNLGLKSDKKDKDKDTKGEFDDLISALRTGDVFGEDMAKFKRSRKKTPANTSPPRRTSVNREDSRERSILRRQ